MNLWFSNTFQHISEIWQYHNVQMEDTHASLDKSVIELELQTWSCSSLFSWTQKSSPDWQITIPQQAKKGGVGYRLLLLVMSWVETIHRHPTIDTNDLACDVRWCRQAEECHQGWDLLRISKATKRSSSKYLFQIFFVA